MEHSMMDIFGIWIGALLTLGILSFLYKDNILYKISEAIFVGISAGYWFVTYYWENLYRQFWLGMFPKDPGTEPKYILIGGVVLGVILLFRLIPRMGWIARWTLAFIVGATFGLRSMGFLSTDALAQVHSTVVDLATAVHGGSGYAIFGYSIIALATLTGLVYFFFSKEHSGWFGFTAKVGTWFLMITFGASFGYTVMSRMSLLIGRVDFLLTDWLRLIR